MKFLIVILLAVIPTICSADFFDIFDPMKKVEDHILANEYEKAKESFYSIKDKKFIFENEWAVVGSIEYLEASIKFYEIINTSDNPKVALDFYSNTVRKDHSKIPKKLPFSKNTVEKINKFISRNNDELNNLNNTLKEKILQEQKEEKIKEQKLEEERQKELARFAEERRLKKQKEEEEENARYLEYKKKELARQKQIEEEAAKRQAERDAAEKERIKKVNSLKAECGEDYRRVRVGMQFSRVEKCVGNFHLTSQINRVDGILSTYENKSGFVHVMDGLVVSWGLY